MEDKVKETIKKYKLLNKKEKIIVACSGGKDSTAALYILKKLGYKVEGLTVNAFIGNYSKVSLENLREFCKNEKIKLHEASLRDEFGCSLCYIVSILKSKGYKFNSCTVCGILRRYLLNKHARKLKADKIVMGHNLDDEAQAVLMNLLRSDLKLFVRQGIKPGVLKDKKFIQRIKPLYFCTEKEVEKYSKSKKFPVKYGMCPCAVTSYRNSVKNMLNKLEKEHPNIKKNLVNNFLKVLPQVKKEVKNEGKLEYCKYCKEPSKKGICRTCEIIGMLRK